MAKNTINPRNGNLFDNWSVVHLAAGMALGWLLPTGVAVAMLVIWEPIEIFVLSPILARFGIDFGHESLRNSLSDIVFDILGVLIAVLLLRNL